MKRIFSSSLLFFTCKWILVILLFGEKKLKRVQVLQKLEKSIHLTSVKTN